MSGADELAARSMLTMRIFDHDRLKWSGRRSGGQGCGREETGVWQARPSGPGCGLHRSPFASSIGRSALTAQDLAGARSRGAARATGGGWAGPAARPTQRALAPSPPQVTGGERAARSLGGGRAGDGGGTPPRASAPLPARRRQRAAPTRVGSRSGRRRSDRSHPRLGQGSRRASSIRAPERRSTATRTPCRTSGRYAASLHRSRRLWREERTRSRGSALRAKMVLGERSSPS